MSRATLSGRSAFVVVAPVCAVREDRAAVTHSFSKVARVATSRGAVGICASASPSSDMRSLASGRWHGLCCFERRWAPWGPRPTLETWRTVMRWIQKATREVTPFWGGPRCSRLWFAFSASAGLLASCGGATTNVEDTIVSKSPLDQEHPGEEAMLVRRKYGVDANVTLASYAALSMDGCSASMIGPNLMMSAAHCGYDDHTALFKVYRRGGHYDQETFICHKLFQTLAAVPYDLQVQYCDPNERGENAGDKYGYLDFDLSTPTVGQDIYSLWVNDLGSPPEASAPSFSRGTRTAFSADNQFVDMHLWARPGSSGSPNINPANNRILIGPTSIGGGLSRSAYSMGDYLRNGQLLPTTDADGTTRFNVNSILLV